MTKRLVKARAVRVLVSDYLFGAVGTMAAVWLLAASRRELFFPNGDVTFWIGQ